MPVPAEQWLPVATVPALVSPALFAQAQAKLAQNRAFARRHNTRYSYLLRALMTAESASRVACAGRSIPATTTICAAPRGWDWIAPDRWFLLVLRGSDGQNHAALEEFEAGPSIALRLMSLSRC